MSSIEIAKNILLGHVCDKCNYYNNIYTKDPYCNHSDSGLRPNIPEENTCKFWKKIEMPEMSIKTINLSAKVRKLNVKWTKESEITMKSFYGEVNDKEEKD